MVRVFAACFFSLQRPQQYQQPPVPPVSSPSIRNSAYSPAKSRLCWRKEGAAKLSAKQNKCRPIWDNRSKSCVCAGA